MFCLNVLVQIILPLRFFARRERSQSSTLKLRNTAKSNPFQCMGCFWPSLCVHANMGQQSAAGILFHDHVWHYHQPIKNKDGRTPSLMGKPLIFYSRALVERGEPNAPQFPFLRKLEERSPAHSCPACPHATPSFGVYFLFTCPYGSCAPSGKDLPASLTSEVEYYKI
jgi:hypothetical protein